MRFINLYKLPLRYSIKIDIDAIKDVQNTFDWYELKSKGLGLRYKSQVKKQINSLKQNPELFSIKYNKVRCRKIEKFPFLIHYEIDETIKLVYVFAVIHTSRNPEIWNTRNNK